MSKNEGNNPSSKSFDSQINKLLATDIDRTTLVSTAKAIAKDKQLLESKGLSYLNAFAAEYPKTGNEFEIRPVPAVINCLKLQAGADVNLHKQALQSIVEDIASGKSNSLTKDPPKLSFVHTTITGIMLKPIDADDRQRTVNAAKTNLSKAGLQVDNSSAIINKLNEEYPMVVGIVSRTDSIKSFEQDMQTIIVAGSGGVEQSHAARYLEMQKLEREVKEQVIAFAKTGTIDSPEAKKYFATKSIEALEHLRSNYENGMTLQQPEANVKQQLTKIEQSINDIRVNNGLPEQNVKIQSAVKIPQTLSSKQSVQNKEISAKGEQAMKDENKAKPKKTLEERLKELKQKVSNYVKPVKIEQKEVRKAEGKKPTSYLESLINDPNLSKKDRALLEGMNEVAHQKPQEDMKAPDHTASQNKSGLSKEYKMRMDEVTKSFDGVKPKKQVRFAEGTKEAPEVPKKGMEKFKKFVSNKITKRGTGVSR